MNGRNVAASVRAKLLNKARAEKRDFMLVLTRYALERLLYRLSISTHADHFLLKGALLFDLWFDVPLRPTRDMDLLGFGLAEEPYLIEAFATDAQKQMQWQGFLKKNRLEALTLEQVVSDLHAFLMPPLSALATGQGFSSAWNREAWYGAA